MAPAINKYQLYMFIINYCIAVGNLMLSCTLLWFFCMTKMDMFQTKDNVQLMPSSDEWHGITKHLEKNVFYLEKSDTDVLLSMAWPAVKSVGK
jgi:hypothetical protein